MLVSRFMAYSSLPDMPKAAAPPGSTLSSCLPLTGQQHWEPSQNTCSCYSCSWGESGLPCDAPKAWSFIFNAYPHTDWITQVSYKSSKNKWLGRMKVVVETPPYEKSYRGKLKSLTWKDWSCYLLTLCHHALEYACAMSAALSLLDSVEPSCSWLTTLLGMDLLLKC